MFLSGQFSPLLSFFGPPLSMPILPTKLMPSNRLRLTVRVARACGETSFGWSPNAESRIAFRVPRLILADWAWPSLLPSRIQYSQNLRPLVRPISEDELDVEHLGVAGFRALEHAVLANVAGLDVHDQRGHGAVRDELVARRRGIGVVVGHVLVSLGLRSLRG
jgi:hypothetical protein